MEQIYEVGLRQTDNFNELIASLLNKGILGGIKGLNEIRQTELYQKTDKILHVEDNIQIAKQRGVEVYELFNEKLYGPLKDRLIIMYDHSTEYLHLVCKLYQTNQEKVLAYLEKHYSNLQVIIKDSWLQLDLEKVKNIDKAQLTQMLKDLFNFLQNFEYLDKLVEIKNAIYQEAQAYIKTEKGVTKQVADQEELE